MIVWYVYDAQGVIMWYLGIMKVWWTVCKWQVEYVLNCEITRILRCCVYWVVSYESYNHTTIRPFKGDELMRNGYYDGIHCENSTSWITLIGDELKLFYEQFEESCVLHSSYIKSVR